MSFLYFIGQVVTHVGMVHTSAIKPAQRLVVVRASVRGIGSPPVEQNWYWVRAVIEGDKGQLLQSEPIECVEAELTLYPT